tara:strand:- start:219 stop:1949 length:1731 start_codon:yes stop_codon:yes gene_type:complete
MFTSIKLIFSILDLKTKQQLFFIFILIFLKSFLDATGIGLIFPLIASFSNPETILSNPMFFEINDKFIKNDKKLLVYYLCIFVLIFFILKNTFNLIISFYINKITFLKRADLSTATFSKYLHAPFDYYLKKNTSELSSNLIYEVGRFYQFIFNLINLCNHILFSFIIIIILILTDWRIVFYALTGIGTISFLTIYFLGNTSKKLGDEISTTQIHIVNTIKEAFNSIAETKIYNVHEYFINNFYKSHFNNAKANWIQLTLSGIPHLIFEIFAISFFCIFAIFILNSNNDLNSYLPLLGLFAVALVRLIPSITSGLKCYQDLRFTSSGVSKVYSDIKNTPSEVIKDIKNPNKTSKDVIKISNLSFGFKNKSLIDNFNIEINQGETIGVYGESGSGKTTLINLILGLLTPTKGKIFFNNQDIREISYTWRKKIGYVGQNYTILNSNIVENIAFGNEDLKNIEKKLLVDSLIEAELKEFIGEDNNVTSKKVGENGNNLSGGQKQRLVLARALYKKPEILILDEFTSSLDEKNEDLIINEILSKKNKKIIIIISHKLKVVNKCDRLVNFNEGKMFIKNNLK